MPKILNNETVLHFLKNNLKQLIWFPTSLLEENDSLKVIERLILYGFQPPFWGRVIESVVASQLQGFIEEMDYLDPFHSTFIPYFSSKTALVLLMDDIHHALDMESTSMLVLSDLSAAFASAWKKQDIIFFTHTHTHTFFTYAHT